MGKASNNRGEEYLVGDDWRRHVASWVAGHGLRGLRDELRVLLRLREHEGAGLLRVALVLRQQLRGFL